MNIRIANPADAQAITAASALIVANTSISFELAAPTVDEMRGCIIKTLQRLPWPVGEDAQGQVNVYVYAGQHRERPAYQWAVDVTADVRQDARGLGIGKRLYQALFTELISLGYLQAFAGIALLNPASVALHESMVFQPIGVLRRVGFKLGAWHDVGCWQKEMRSPFQHCQPNQPAQPAQPDEPKAFVGRAAG